MKTLYLHVGMHKTGSTSIQTALTRERASLLEQGIYLPLTATDDNTHGHHNLAWELNRHRRFDADAGTLADLHAELTLAKADTVILSAEGFTSSDSKPGFERARQVEQADQGLDNPVKRANRYQRVRELAKSLNYSIVVVGFVRDYASCLNSAYTQQIKTFKHGLSFQSFIYDQLPLERWCYGSVFAGWEAIAREVVCVASGDDNVVTLFSIMNASMKDGAPQRENVGVGPKTVESSRLLFKALERQAHRQCDGDRSRRSDGTTGMTPRKVVQEASERHGWNDDRYWGFESDRALAVHAEFADRDTVFLARHGVRFGTSFLGKVQNDFLVKDAPDQERKQFLRVLEGIWVDLGLAFDRHQVKLDSKALRTRLPPRAAFA